MSGPLKFKVTDRMSCSSPPLAVKEWTDVIMLIFDFSHWLGPDQHLSAASDVSLLFNPTTQVGSWGLFNCCSCNSDPPDQEPVDLNPITVYGLELLPGNKKVGISLGAGTPGFTYLASFITSAGPYPRRKEVGAMICINGTIPAAGTPPMPPPLVEQVIDVYFNVTLPNNFIGDVNIMNGGITITLPSNPLRGQAINFKDVTGVAGSTPITIHTVSSLIDGQSNFYLYENYQAAGLYWTGTGWGVR